MESSVKSEVVLEALRDHLANEFPFLSSSLALSQIRSDTAGRTSLVMPLKMRSEPVNSSTRGYVTMGLPLDTPTFMLQFTPVAIVSDKETPAPSSRSLFTVNVATYHGVVLKKDYITFYMTFPPTTSEVVDTTTMKADMKSSLCEMLDKFDSFQDGFRLCAGISEGKSNPSDTKQVYIEPFGEDKSLCVIRSRQCAFMLELEDMYPPSDMLFQKGSGEKTMCDQCQRLECNLIAEGEMKVRPVIMGRKVAAEQQESDYSEEEENNIIDEEQLETEFVTVTKQEVKVEIDSDPEWQGIRTRRRGKRRGVVEHSKCGKCGKEFKYEQALNSHVEKCTGNGSGGQLPAIFKCPNCKRDFRYQINYTKHLEVCDGPVKSRRKRLLGVKKKTGPKVKMENRGEKERVVHTCNVCFRQFTSGGQYEKHLELHKERVPKLYQETECPQWGCEQVFPDRLQLVAHYIQEHKGGETVPCVYCLEMVSTHKMRAHIRNDHPHQQFLCSLCGKGCLYKSQLRTHIRDNHGGEKPRDVVCEICGKRYRRETGLRQHMVSAHSDQRDFVCAHCGKGFTTHTRLTQHLRIHSGAKPFKCKKCEYRSNRSDNVLYHCRKVHKMLKPTRDDVFTFADQLAEESRSKVYSIDVLQLPEQTSKETTVI